MTQIAIITGGIQKGDSTHHQLQEITLHSFRAMNSTVNRSQIPTAAVEVVLVLVIITTPFRLLMY